MTTRLSALPLLTGKLRAAERETRLDLAHLHLASRAAGEASLREPALLCEQPALCYWAGSPARIDLFSARQAFLSDRANEADLIAAIERREFAGIQLEMVYTEERSDRISPELLAATLRSYRILRESNNGFFLQPRLTR